MSDLPRIAGIAAGGAAGTLCRYYVAAWMLARYGGAFPYGTLTVNLVGSLLLGVLFGVGSASTWIGPTLMLALTTGFMGGFTTYSTFSLDLFKQLQAGSYGAAAAYLALTLGAGLAGTAGGYYAAISWFATDSGASR